MSSTAVVCRMPCDLAVESGAAGRVLLVGNFLSSTGGNRGVCEELACRLAGAGWSVLTTSPRAGRLSRLTDMLATAWRNRHHYDVAQVDVFSGTAFVWAEAVCGLLRLMGKPYVLTLHGGNLPSFAARWPRRTRRLLQSARAVTTPSRYLLEQMRDFGSPLRLLPNPLDLSTYEYLPRVSPRPRLVWLRAFHSTYNPPLAVEVLGQIRRDFPTCELFMVGPDKGDGSRRKVEETAERLRVSEAVHLTGGVGKSEVPRWLNEGDIFLNSTNVDNTPISVLEAMACGLCVVSTAVGGIPYLLENEHDALLVPPRNCAEMAQAVRRILAEPGLGERLSANARRKAEQFDWSATLPQWTSLLTGLVSGRTLQSPSRNVTGI